MSLHNGSGPMLISLPPGLWLVILGVMPWISSYWVLLLEEWALSSHRQISLAK